MESPTIMNLTNLLDMGHEVIHLWLRWTYDTAKWGLTPLIVCAGWRFRANSQRHAFIFHLGR